MKINAAAYHGIIIKENGEPLVRLEERPGVKFFDRSRLMARPRTKDFYLRETAAEKLYLAAQNLLDATGGNFELYVRDAYRLMQAQRLDWKEGLEYLYQETKDLVKTVARAKILYSDPTDFDENDPETWAQNTPLHTTGGAVDLFMISKDGVNHKEWLFIDNYPDRVAHFETDYFERKENLTETETMVRDNRRLLVRAMEDAGFKNYPREAWHFDYGDQMWGLLSKENAIYGYAKNPEE